MRASMGMVCSLALWFAICVASPAVAAQCPDSAQVFWKSFRAKALTKDPAVLLKYVRFPFEVRGTLDSSNQKQFNREAFLSAYALLLSTDPGMSPEPTTMEAIIKKTTKVPKTACDEAGTEFRLGTWTFDLTPAGWRFVRAFVED